MTDKELLEQIIIEQLDLVYDDINDFSTLEELGAEDGDCEEIIQAIKDEFSVELEETLIYDLTIEDMYCIIQGEDDEA